LKNTGLVLEGGGMRGVYTCGVLEYFMEKDLFFKYIIGVSAGACNAVSYITKQKGRNERVCIDFVSDWRYMSFRSLIQNKCFFGMDFIFDEIPNKHVPFDFEAFYKADCKFVTVATDCHTGKPVYFQKDDMDEKFSPLRASASLPLISPMVDFKNYKLLDGGISDSIPILKAIEDGNKKNIVILTRNKAYRKVPMKHTSLIKFKYRKYPRLVEAMLNRYKAYNDTLDYIDNEEKNCNAFIIRPTKEIKVGRTEKDPDKLRELFKNGYEDAKEHYEKIREFLGI
jgi:Predicted esterase of the alpha-beta hydrolase superfamily